MMAQMRRPPANVNSYATVTTSATTTSSSAVERSSVPDLDSPPIIIEHEAMVSALSLSATLVRRRFRVASHLTAGLTPRTCYQPSTMQTLFHSSTSTSLSSPSVMSSFLPNGAPYLPFNTPKAFPAFPAPVDLALTLLHDARITSRLRDECTPPSARRLSLTRPVQFRALTVLLLRAPPIPTPRRPRCGPDMHDLHQDDRSEMGVRESTRKMYS
jgi:hypothetical protein